jgi:flagellar hook-associated protein 3 FlgL
MQDTKRLSAIIDDSERWLEMTEDVASGLAAVLRSAMELATRARSSTIPIESRGALALQVDQLIRQSIDTANRSTGTRPLLSGYETGKLPVQALQTGGEVTGVAFSGDQGKIIRQLGPGATMEVSSPASEVLGPAGSSIIEDLISLRDAIRWADGSELNESAGRLDGHHSRLVAIMGEIGAKTNRLALERERNAQEEIALSDLLSRIEDTDIAECTVRAQAASHSYATVLAVGARIVQPTLVDFLR